MRVYRNHVLSTFVAIFALVVLAGTDPALAQFKNAPATGGFPLPTGQIAFIREKDVWLMEADGSNAHELVTTGRADNRVVWSPDNQEILYCQYGVMNYDLPGGGGGAVKLYDVFAVRMDNPKLPKQISQDALSSSPAYFPDGKLIAYVVNLHSFDVHAELPNYQVYVAGVYGNPSAKPLNTGKLTSKLQLNFPAVSPDGKTIAVCVTDEQQVATPQQVYGIAFVSASGFTADPDTFKKNNIAIRGGFGPSYSPDGRFVAFIDATTKPRSLSIWDVEKKSKKVIFTAPGGNDLNTSAPSWSSDGNWIVFATNKGNVMLVDRGGKNSKLLTAQGTDAFPAFSN